MIWIRLRLHQAALKCQQRGDGCPDLLVAADFSIGWKLGEVIEVVGGVIANLRQLIIAGIARPYLRLRFVQVWDQPISDHITHESSQFHDSIWILIAGGLTQKTGQGCGRLSALFGPLK